MNKTIKNLKELRDAVHGLNYQNIYNQLSDILNEANNDKALDYFYDSDILTEYDAEERAEYELRSRGLDGLRCFINETRADDIYKLDGYGNLDNVTDADFLNLIDEIINILEDEIGQVQ